jgi:hypothetical protein
MVLAAAFSMAQSVALHGYLDYTNFLVSAYGLQNGSDMWLQSQYTASYGSWYSGRTEVRLAVDAANFQFNAGMRLSNSLGTWVTPVASEVFYMGNIRADFLDGQVRLFTGKFEEEAFGYRWTTLAAGTLMGNHWGVSNFMHWLGQSTMDNLGYDPQYLTALEVRPAFIDGLSVIAAVPISINGLYPNLPTGAIAVADYWQNILPRFKAGVSYFVSPINATFKAFYFNGDDFRYADNVAAGIVRGDCHRDINVEMDMPNVANIGLGLRAAYDLQLYTATAGAMKHNAIISAAFTAIPHLFVALDYRFAYASNYYTAANSVMMNKVWVKATYEPVKNFIVGLQGNAGVMTDSSGQIGAPDISGDDGDLGFSLSNSGHTLNTLVIDGTTGLGLGFGVNPYAQLNFSNGFVSLGFDIQYIGYTSATTNMALSFAVPLTVVFWF